MLLVQLLLFVNFILYVTCLSQLNPKIRVNQNQSTNQLDTIYQWKVVDYEFKTNAARQLALDTR